MRIRNIGCFGPEGIDIELDNIVCLVGANNAGKSTVLRCYEAAVGMEKLRPEEICSFNKGEPASVELWVHIPEGTPNVAEKWKEADSGLLLVRSKWTWKACGAAPVRTTWDPSERSYTEDATASGLDQVFASRLPKPFRIKSLQDPAEEHSQLLKLVLEPIKRQLKALTDSEESELVKLLESAREEARKPIEAFKKELEDVEKQVNSSFGDVFHDASAKVVIDLDQFSIDPAKSLESASRIDVMEAHGATRWSQQGTGSQRALFWSMLEVRSELNRRFEAKLQVQKELKEKKKKLVAAQKGLAGAKTDATKAKRQTEVAGLENEIKGLEAAADGTVIPPTDSSSPGYMLLIDEPETALHPSAIRAAKDHLYALAEQGGWQVMLSTHHPVFIDPVKDHTTIVRLHRTRDRQTPNVYRAATMNFSPEEIQNLKSLLAFDTTLAEMFFGSKVVVVEGDTELASFTAAMDADPVKYPVSGRPLIVRARGKGTISVLIRMLTHFRVGFSVLHDIDAPKARKKVTNDDGTTETTLVVSPAYGTNATITELVASARDKGLQVVHNVSCPEFERHHGMDLPKKDKPYKAWQKVEGDKAVRAGVVSVLDRLIGSAADGATASTDGSHYESILREWLKSNPQTTPEFDLDATAAGE